MTNGAFLDRERPPTRDELAAALGATHALWERLVARMRATYGLEGEPLFDGRDSGWVLRYRRSGKTLLVLLPESGAARALVVVGPSIAEAAAALPLEPEVRAAFDRAHAYPDGRWLRIEVGSEAVADDLLRLVELKSPPPRRPRRAAAAGP